MQSLYNLARNPGGVTKQWNFSATDAAQGRRERPHKVRWVGGWIVGAEGSTALTTPQPHDALQLMLRHNKITGARFVVLDGVEVPGTRGNTNILNAVEISFPIDGQPAVVTITPDVSVGGFVYSCRVGNRFLTELADTLEPEQGDLAPPVKAAVPEIRTNSSGEGKLIVNYKVVVTLGGDPAGEVTVFRRFREFDKLDRLIRSALAGNHLLNSLPPLPGGSVVLGLCVCVCGCRPLDPGSTWLTTTDGLRNTHAPHTTQARSGTPSRTRRTRPSSSSGGRSWRCTCGGSSRCPRSRLTPTCSGFSNCTPLRASRSIRRTSTSTWSSSFDAVD